MQNCNIAGVSWQHPQGRGPGRHRTPAQGPGRARGSHPDIGWTDCGLVFTTDFDGPVDPGNLLRVVELAAANVGIVG
jgi:hypothetical protein